MLNMNKKFSASMRNFGLFVVLLAVMFVLPKPAASGSYDDFFKAVEMDGADDIKALLRRGLDPNLIEGDRGESGLMLALRADSMKVFNLLANARGIDFEAKALNGDTALMIAALKGNKPAVETLLAKKAQPNKPGWTALHYAASIGHNEIVQLLLDKSAFIDAESPNKTTPIMMAARGGHILTVKLLLDQGADASLKNEQGLTAIDLARKFGHADIVDGLTYRLKKAGKL
ncbi:ankyrin repeat domain-containing protein [soil metagenome]